MNHVMDVLGLSATEESIYRHFLRNPDSSGEDLHVAVRADQDTTMEAVDRLRSLGLLYGDEHRLYAAEPAAAVPRLAEAGLEDLLARMRTLTSTRHILTSLERDRPRRGPSGPGGPGGPVVEQLEDVSRLRDRIDDLSFFARSEVLSAKPDEKRTPEYIAHARQVELRCLRRGVRMRGVVRRTALDDPPTSAYLRELALHGAEIKVMGDFTEMFLIYDRHTALLPVDARDISRGALCTRERALVGNSVTLFERLWASAAAFPDPEDGTDASGSGLTEPHLSALRLMCTVAKDELGARKLGVSLRTYRRYLAELMALLNAENRAQAALTARERGWV